MVKRAQDSTRRSASHTRQTAENTLSHRTENVTYTETVVTDDGEGNDLTLEDKHSVTKA
jgi:hypothetical protein